MRGNWAVSPLWEGKILLGVLKEQGLAGRGLVSAFEHLAPMMVGASRLDMNRTYSKQTGRELSDYILVQQADKAVRYSQLPPEAASRALLSTSELAVLTGFAPKTIRRWASRRLLNFIRVGNQFRFRPAAVELFLAPREIGK
jgi:excisionase family DNA binding protein